MNFYFSQTSCQILCVCVFFNKTKTLIGHCLLFPQTSLNWILAYRNKTIMKQRAFRGKPTKDDALSCRGRYEEHRHGENCDHRGREQKHLAIEGRYPVDRQRVHDIAEL